KSDVCIVDIGDAMIRDRYAVGVTGQILQHMLRSAEGPLGIHDPVLAKECAQESRCSSVREKEKATTQGSRGLIIRKVAHERQQTPWRGSGAAVRDLIHGARLLFTFCAGRGAPRSPAVNST